MKKILFLIAFVAAAGFYACDKVEGPTRENVSIDTSCHFDADNSVPVKKTLMTEFTGHLCGNCPPASIYLSDTLKEKYGDSLVIVSIHSGYFACTCPSGNLCGSCPGGGENDHYLTDFTNQTSDDWYAYYGIVNNPKGVVDGAATLSYQTWDAAIANRLTVPAKVRIKILNTYTDADRRVRACVETKFLSNMTDDYKLSVLLTEDDIVDYQEWYNHAPQHVSDYVHHHVLRTAFNTSLGIPIASDTTAANTAITSGYNINLDPAWNADNCYVVAFVYNVTTNEVVQVEEVKVK
jgi:hypothetical protein